MAPQPGILYVTMQPSPSLSMAQFHDWYNNEHGPTRLRLPFVANGFRYQASDLPGSYGTEERPEWMAVYDIRDMTELGKEAYLRLRDPPVKSPRETKTMAEIKVDRRLYDLVDEKSSPDHQRLENVEHEGQQNMMVAISLGYHDEKQDEVDKWYREEHADLVSRVPGWLRSRRYVTSSLDPHQPFECLLLHEYGPKNGLVDSESQQSISTKWAQSINDDVGLWKNKRTYNLYYTFGPAPRHLSPQMADWELTDPLSSKTKTFSKALARNGAIESWITTPDGVELEYRLEGSADPNAPLIVLVNSILVTWGIWDNFLQSFFDRTENKGYRILRYLTRGRTSNFGAVKVTVDVLAADIIALLDGLRVRKAAAIIGVSLGGCTTLNAALCFPDRVASFISCDTSAKSPSGNAKAWGDRVAIAQSESAVSPNSNEKIVGSKLAELTTKRWFVPASYDGGQLEKRCWEVNEMVKTNSFEGFKHSVEALFDYDLTEQMKTSTVKGMFLVGASDGVLPGTMASMSQEYGKEGLPLYVMQGAGHLPMVEKPKEFAQAVTDFLSS